MLRTTLKKIGWVSQANRLVKARLQERSVASTLARYRREAERLGVTVPAGAELEHTLRSRIAERRQGRSSKSEGVMHVFLAYPLANWEFVLPLSLAPFGRVTTFEWRSEGFDETAADWLDHRDAMNQRMLEAFHNANREQPVDAVVGYLSGHNTAPEILQAMGREGAVVFNFCFDDKLHFPGRMVGGRHSGPAAIAHAVDLNLTNAEESTVKYAVHGGLALFWPQGAQAEIHRPYETGFDFDVSFVGACYGWRPRFIARLRRLGVQVECFGKGWPNGALTDEEMIRLYSRSRINLGSSGVAHSRTLTCLKGRDFEVPMSGGLYLTQHHRELERVFVLGEEILTYRDAADCARQIAIHLADPGRAQAVREAGRRRCLAEHTWYARWRRAFEIAGLLTTERPSAASPSVGDTAEAPREAIPQGTEPSTPQGVEHA